MEANLVHATGTLGASLTEAESGKALSDRPALEAVCIKVHVRICAGGVGQLTSLPRRLPLVASQESGIGPKLDGVTGRLAATVVKAVRRSRPSN